MTIELSQELQDALALYVRLEQAVVSAGRRTDPARKLDLVQARRKFSEQLGHVWTLIDSDQKLREHPEKQREMGQLFSAFRYALGQHQADWPAVRIDEDPQGYAANARLAYVKSDIFWDWCRANIRFSHEASVKRDRLITPLRG